MLHFAVAPGAHQPWTPDGLSLDLADGKAYLSLLVFKLKNNRVRATPPVPWLSDFPEISLRTYVRCGKKPGIYFLSIETSRRPVAWLAKYVIMEAVTRHGAYRTQIFTVESDLPMFRYTTSFKAAEPLLIPFWPRDIVSLTATGVIGNTFGDIHVAQEGGRSGGGN